MLRYKTQKERAALVPMSASYLLGEARGVVVVMVMFADIDDVLMQIWQQHLCDVHYWIGIAL
jgi:hypothetical protein